jgi:hypothetical protein
MSRWNVRAPPRGIPARRAAAGAPRRGRANGRARAAPAAADRFIPPVSLTAAHRPERASARLTRILDSVPALIYELTRAADARPRPVDRLDLLENLARDLLVVACRIATGVGLNLRAVDRDHAHLRPGRPAGTARGPSRTGPPAPARDARRTGRSSRDPASPARRSHGGRRPLHRPAQSPAPTARLARRRKQQRHHHRRLLGQPAAAVLAIGRIERGQIHRSDRIEDKPRQMSLRQPLPHIRRHQERLLATTRDEALHHTGSS